MKLDHLGDSSLAKLANQLWEQELRADAAGDLSKAALASSKRARVSGEIAIRAINRMLERLSNADA